VAGAKRAGEGEEKSANPIPLPLSLLPYPLPLSTPAKQATRLVSWFPCWYSMRFKLISSAPNAANNLRHPFDILV